MPTDRLTGFESSVALKYPCHVQTNAAITLSGEQTVNGSACVTGDRVLVKDQADTKTNGIYVVSTGVWTRADDFDGDNDVVQGTLCVVYSTNVAETIYKLTSANPIVIGTSALVFVQAVLNSVAAAGVTYTPTGTGAVARTMQTKIAETVISVTDYGAVGDGVTNDRTAFVNALAAASGKALYLPNPASAYLITGAVISVPANTRVYGQSRNSTIVRMGSAADLFDAGNYTQFHDFYIDGNSVVGHGIIVSGTNGQQIVKNMRITDTGASCIHFAATTAGEGFVCDDTLMYQKNGGAGTAKYAVTIADGVQAAAVPRKFHNIETGGNCSFSFGGAADLFIANSFIADCAWSANSHGVNIMNSRWATVTAQTLLGGQHTIMGCDVYPSITIGLGASGVVIGPNTYNSTMPVDASGQRQNLIYHWDEAYTPTYSSVGGGGAIGNGSITAYWSRDGNKVSVNIQMIWGTTTTAGAGAMQWTLPTQAPSFNPLPQVCGEARGYDVSANFMFFGPVMIANSTGTGVTTATLQRDHETATTSNAFTGSAPATWATTDQFHVTFTYTV